MAMAKTPEQVAREQAQRDDDSKRQEDQSGPPGLVTLRNTLRGWHWAGYTKILELVDQFTMTDRQHAQVKKRVLDVANDQERSMAVLVNRLYPAAAPVQGEGDKKSG